MMKTKKKLAAFVLALAIACTSMVAVIPAFGIETNASGYLNQIVNMSALGGTWNNQGKSTTAYSNFYHGSAYHWSSVSSGQYPGQAGTASAGAGSWSYATLNRSFSGNFAFFFYCGRN